MPTRRTIKPLIPRPDRSAHAATYRRPALASALSVAMAVGIMAGSSAGIAAAATPANTLNLKVLVIGGNGGALSIRRRPLGTRP